MIPFIRPPKSSAPSIAEMTAPLSAGRRLMVYSLTALALSALAGASLGVFAGCLFLVFRLLTR